MALQKLKDEDGAALVEMALVLPLLMLILFGILEFGILLERWQVLTNGAREGARLGIVHIQDTCADATVAANVQQAVVNYVNAAGIGMTIAAGDVAVTSTGGGDLCTRGNTVQVQVANTYNWVVMPGFLAALAPSIQITGTSAMRHE